MWSYIQTLSPLLTIALAAAICLGVLSFIMAETKPQQRGRDQYRPMPPSGGHNYEGQ
jgi:hypothetical protein